MTTRAVRPASDREHYDIGWFEVYESESGAIVAKTFDEDMANLLAGTASRHIVFDLDTGDMLRPFGGALGGVWRKIASQCMPGTTPELLDEWYSAHMEHDDPKQPGRLVWMPTGPADRIAQLEALVASLRAGGSVAPS